MITNEYQVTKQLYLKWFKEGQKKGVQLKITIMWLCIMAIILAGSILFAVMYVREGRSSSDMLPWFALEAAMLIYCVYHLFFRRRIAASGMYDKMACQLGHDWTKTIEFTDKTIHTVEGSFEVNYPYSEIQSVKNYGNEILIITDKNIIIRVYKDKFTQGDFPRFKRFIESKAVNKCFLN